MNCFPQPTWYSLTNTNQYVLGLLYCKGILLIYLKLICRHPQFVFYSTVLQPVGPYFVLLHMFILPCVQDSIWSCWTSWGLFFWTSSVCFSSMLTFFWLSALYSGLSTAPHNLENFFVGGLHPLFRLLMKIIFRHLSQDGKLCCWVLQLPFSHSSAPFLLLSFKERKEGILSVSQGIYALSSLYLSVKVLSYMCYAKVSSFSWDIPSST